MLLILPIILLRMSFKFACYSKIIPNLYLLFLNYSLKQLQYPTYVLSTQHNIYYLNCARIGPLQHLKLSWTRKIFDCGFKLT